MLTDYDIQRLSKAIVENLCENDKFINRIGKLMQKDKRNLINSTKAAKILGITRKSVCQIAEHLNGIRGKGDSAHWYFHEDTLIDLYIRYKQEKEQ